MTNITNITKLLLICVLLGGLGFISNLNQAQAQESAETDNMDDLNGETTDGVADDEDQPEEITDSEITQDDTEGSSADLEESVESDVNTIEDENEFSDVVDIVEEEVMGEVIAIDNDFVTILTAAGDQRRVSLGGGGLLSPFVRAVQAGDIEVGDSVELTLATEISTSAQILEINPDGSLVIQGENGQVQTLPAGSNNFEVRQNGQIITDYSSLQPGDEIELVITGELLTDVQQVEPNTRASWVVPVLVILIVLALAALLAKRNRSQFE
jgi:hypothetical protein